MSAARAAHLIERHFAMQEQRPARLEDVEVAALDPFLRSLVFTDGTVTRALGVQTLSPVEVEVISQSMLPISNHAAGCLEAPAKIESVQRRVMIGVGSPAAEVLWAESFLLPERLPDGFLGLLDSAADGIGQSLQQTHLESSRELLWFGLGAAPRWAPTPSHGATKALSRLYRVIHDAKPAILIAESFAVEWRAGAYRLAALA
jgi:chorismate-pyruvate lyase